MSPPHKKSNPFKDHFSLYSSLSLFQVYYIFLQIITSQLLRCINENTKFEVPLFVIDFQFSFLLSTKSNPMSIFFFNSNLFALYLKIRPSLCLSIHDDDSSKTPFSASGSISFEISSSLKLNHILLSQRQSYIIFQSYANHPTVAYMHLLLHKT
jgi:hypothetical protein